MTIPVIPPKANYNAQNEGAFREEVRRKLDQTYDVRSDLIVPFGKKLTFTSAQGQEITFGYNASGQFTIKQDASTPFSLASISYVSSVESTLNGSIATVSSEVTAARSGEANLLARITTVNTAAVNANSAASTAQSEITAARAGEANLLARITTVNTAAVNAAGAASTAQSEVTAARQGEASLTAKVTQLASATSTVDGKLSASYALTVDGGGRIASMKLLSDGTTTSVKFKADTFSIYNGTSDVPMFEVSGGAAYVAGSKVRTESMTDSAVTAVKIDANAVTTDKINAGAVTASKITVSSLSAITATIGTLRTATSGARVEIKDNIIEVYDATRLRVRLGIWT